MTRAVGVVYQRCGLGPDTGARECLHGLSLHLDSVLPSEAGFPDSLQEKTPHFYRPRKPFGYREGALSRKPLWRSVFIDIYINRPAEADLQRVVSQRGGFLGASETLQKTKVVSRLRTRVSARSGERGYSCFTSVVQQRAHGGEPFIEANDALASPDVLSSLPYSLYSSLHHLRRSYVFPFCCPSLFLTLPPFPFPLCPLSP